MGVSIFLIFTLLNGLLVFLFWSSIRKNLFLGLFVATSIFIHNVYPALQEYIGWYRYQNEYPLNAIVVSNLYYSLFLSVTLISCSALKKGPHHPIRIVNPNSWNRNFLFLIFASFIGIYAYATQVTKIYASGLDQYFRNRIEYGLGNGLMTSLRNFILSVIAFIALLRPHISLTASRSKRIRILLVLFALIAFSVVTNTILSSRNTVFLIVVIFMVVTIVSRRQLEKPPKLSLKLSIRYISIFLAVAFIFSNMTDFRRVQSGAESKYQDSSVTEEFIKQLNGAFGNNENMLFMLSNSFEAEKGVTYLAAVTNFIPRSLWPNKPLGAGPRIRNIIYPGSYVVGRRGNSSITTGAVVESFLNFRFIGVLIIAPLIGLVLQYAHKKSREATTIRTCLFWTITGVFVALALVYSEFLGWFARLLFTLLPLILIKD